MAVSPESDVAQYVVQWWVILLAVLAGILILALMVFMLWKVRGHILYVVCRTKQNLLIFVINVAAIFHMDLKELKMAAKVISTMNHLTDFTVHNISLLFN